jgi:Mor family transcriptional regulator
MTHLAIVQDPNTDKEPDILAELLAVLRQKAPDLAPHVLHDVEAQIRRDFGGQRVYLPKRRKHLDHVQQQQLYQDGLSNASTEQITAKHKISRATLYRHMKRFGS